MKFQNDISLHNSKRRIGQTETLTCNILQRKIYQQIIQKLIHNIYESNPTGLIYVKILSQILKRSIIVWQDGQIICIFGKHRNGEGEINVEYKEYNTSALSDKTMQLGHWTLKGGKNPQKFNAIINDCLFDVIASQTCFEISELRQKIICAIRRDEMSIAKFILSNYKPSEVATCMLGGARYEGTSPRDAQRVLDASQNGQCHPEGRSGHPRGHASYSSASRREDSIENYSQSRWRSGFLSREDQDLVCHYTLITNQARDLMDTLNRGQFKTDAHVGRNQLDYYPLPEAQIWDRGSPQRSPSEFRHVVLVGKHFLNRNNDPYSDIFILTFYPVL